MKMHIILIIFTLLVSCRSKNKTNEEKNHISIHVNESSYIKQKYILDTIIVKSIDLSDQLENEIVKYHLKVSDWSKPVNWEFIILSGKDTLFHEYSNEAIIDTFFHDNLYVRDCEGYFDCKKKWYLQYILDFKVEEITPNDRRIPLLKKVSKYFANDENSIFGKSKKEAIKNYNYFWKYYSGKNMKIVYFNFAPEGRSTPILAFHPGIKKLVPIYSP